MRRNSSHFASSSTCGAGKFSMADSISAILLIVGIQHGVTGNGKGLSRRGAGTRRTEKGERGKVEN
jgi:hypothetical protein